MTDWIGTPGKDSLAIAGPRPWVDVRAYGAAGDGVTDDAGAIQTAINQASTGEAAGALVYFPRGIYTVGTTLTVPDGGILFGHGQNSTLKAKANSNLANGVVQITGGNTRLLHLYIDGNKANNSSGIGVLIDGGSATLNAYLDDVYIKSCKSHGLQINASTIVRAGYIIVEACDGNGVHMGAVTTFSAKLLVVSGNANNGFQATGLTESSFGFIEASENGHYGIEWVAPSRISATVMAENNGWEGINIASGTTSDIAGQMLIRATLVNNHDPAHRTAGSYDTTTGVSNLRLRRVRRSIFDFTIEDTITGDSFGNHRGVYVGYGVEDCVLRGAIGAESSQLNVGIWFNEAGAGAGETPSRRNVFGPFPNIQATTEVSITSGVKVYGNDNNFQYVDGVTIPLDRDVVAADITNIATEQTVYSFVVPGGILSTNKAIRFDLLGDILANTAGTLTVKVKYGGAEAFNSSALDFTDNASRRNMRLRVVLSAANDAAQQRIQTEYLVTAPGAQDGGALAISGTTEGADYVNRMGFNNNFAIDSTADQTLAVTFTWSAASTSLSARAHVVHAEIIH